MDTLRGQHFEPFACAATIALFPNRGVWCTELLQTIDFPLDGGKFALNPKLLELPGTAERRPWGQAAQPQCP